MRHPPPDTEPFTIDTQQTLLAPIDRVFAFFERPENLEVITPPFLRFRITSPRPIEMRVGALIDYRLTVRAVPIRWRTEITEYDPPRRFVDVQLKGPYRLWHHTHTFERVLPSGGQPERVIMRDRVLYLLPRVAIDPVATMVNALLVRPDLERVFAYRARKVAELLGQSPLPRSPPP